MITLSITEEDIFTALGNALTNFLPASVAVVRGQQNRVPEPAGTDFVVMWPLLRPRLSQNVDSYADIAFIGSISGLVLTVTQMLQGTLTAGLVLDAANLAANTVLGTQISGSPAGGVGTYNVSPTQNLASTTFQAGSKDIMQPIQFTAQLDVHGPNSADNAQIITTLMRDEYGVSQFNLSGFDIEPLYCNEPRQMPFINGEQQQEERWIVEAVMQANPIVSVPQEFAGSVSVTIIDVL